MRQPSNSPGTGPPGRRSVPIALLLAAIALAIVGCVFIDTLLDGPDRPEPSGPAATASQRPGPTVIPASPTIAEPRASSRPPTVPGLMGDYRCLTLADATDAIDGDGYVVGRVSYSIEGGAVDATWLVDTQDPPPGQAAASGARVDLLLASPFNVC